jgi:tetratricopeptide (TPR) repeat protein
MKNSFKNVFILAVLYVFLSTRADAEPIAIGFAMSDGVVVYADSAFEATPIDTLDFAEYRLVLGDHINGARVFNRNGWAQIEDKEGNRGWARYEEMAITKSIRLAPMPDDSIFAQPSLNATFRFLAQHRQLQWIDEREINDGRLWLGRRHGGTMWFLMKQFDVEWEDAYAKLVEHFLQDPGSMYEGPFQNLIPQKDYDKALAVANRLEQAMIPGDTLFIEAYSSADRVNWIVGAGAYTADLKSRIYRLQGRLNPAIQELQRIIMLYERQPLFIGRAGVEASLDLASIYLSTLHDTTRAIEQYHEIIQRYPDEEISGFEWNDWADIRAAWRIISLVEHQPERLNIEAERIITTSNITAVKLIGYRGKVHSLGLQGRFQAMMDTALNVIAEYPQVQRPYYLSWADFSNSIASTALWFIRSLKDPEQEIQFLEEIRTRFSAYPVGGGAALRLAKQADRTDGNLSTLRWLYKRVVEEHEEFRFYDAILHEDLTTYMASRRLDDLQESGIQNIAITGAPAPFMFGPEPDAPIIEILLPGTRVRFLYSDRLFLRTPRDTSRVVKVELEDGRAGWIPRDRVPQIRNP